MCGCVGVCVCVCVGGGGCSLGGKGGGGGMKLDEGCPSLKTSATCFLFLFILEPLVDGMGMGGQSESYFPLVSL